MGASTPAVRGTVLALASALAFGLTTPLVQMLVKRGSGVGAFPAAMLLYLGSAMMGLVSRSPREAPVRREHAGRLVAVGLSGALVAPVLLAWGLAHTNGTSGSLMLNLEALFTIALARVLHREHVGRRVVAAAVVLLVGGALLVLDRVSEEASAPLSILGLVAVAAAALFWALDNALARPLSALDPAAVVAAKGGIGVGASLALTIVILFTQGGGATVAWPSPFVGASIVVVGGVGFGASLRLYLLAQRALGAGRTASVFASGPFWGAALAWALGEPTGPFTALCALVMMGGVALHLTERHGHAHAHSAIEHEHAHRHDDGHHDHGHAPMPEGEHTHRHAHPALVHDHPHLPDLHHDHDHDPSREQNET